MLVSEVMRSIAMGGLMGCPTRKRYSVGLADSAARGIVAR